MNERARNPRIMNGTGMMEKREIQCERMQVELGCDIIGKAEMWLKSGDEGPEIGDLVEIFSLSGSLGLFVTETRDEIHLRDGGRQTHVTLSHGLSLIGRRILPGWREIGGEGCSIGECIRLLLAESGCFTLRECDFSTCFSYGFENENLLTAMFSLREPLEEESMFICDFSTYPWGLSLKRTPEDPLCEINLQRNCQGIQAEIDSSSLVTRLYPLGYGEGADQLTIAGVNGGVPYLASANADIFGIYESVMVRQETQDPHTLMSEGLRALHLAENPTVTVTANAWDFHSLTHSTYDEIVPGKVCRVDFSGKSMDLPVRRVVWEDMIGSPQLIRVTLGSEKQDVGAILAELRRKSQISERYSQGAASEYAVHFGDNCDSQHPAVLRFFIDRDAIHINSVDVHFSTEKFRAYSKSAGSTTSRGATTGDQIQLTGGAVTAVASANDSQRLTLAGRTLTVADGKVTIPQSSVTVPSHMHSVSIPSHTHTLESYPHSHGINYGIYETGGSSAITIQVDGNDVPQTSGSFDAVPYLKKDSSGRILRGAWHQITFTPDTLARIEADLHLRSFIRSLTGAGK